MLKYITCLVIFLLALSLPVVPWTAEASADEKEYLVLGSGNRLPANLAALVNSAGGSVVRELGAIGVAVVRSSSPGFAAALETRPGIQGVALDSEVQWLREVTDLDSLQVHEPSVPPASPGPSGHLPAIPPLFGSQWNMARIQANLA